MNNEIIEPASSEFIILPKDTPIIQIFYVMMEPGSEKIRAYLGVYSRKRREGEDPNDSPTHVKLLKELEYLCDKKPEHMKMNNPRVFDAISRDCLILDILDPVTQDGFFVCGNDSSEALEKAKKDARDLKKYLENIKRH